jgi:hypothetical protein
MAPTEVIQKSLNFFRPGGLTEKALISVGQGIANESYWALTSIGYGWLTEDKAQ